MNPWNIIGWLIVLVMVAAILSVPPFIIWAIRNRRRASASIDNIRRDVRRGVRGDARFAAPPPLPPGSSPPPPPTK